MTCGSELRIATPHHSCAAHSEVALEATRRLEELLVDRQRGLDRRPVSVVRLPFVWLKRESTGPAPSHRGD